MLRLVRFRVRVGWYGVCQYTHRSAVASPRSQWPRGAAASEPAPRAARLAPHQDLDRTPEVCYRCLLRWVHSVSHIQSTLCFNQITVFKSKNPLFLPRNICRGRRSNSCKQLWKPESHFTALSSVCLPQRQSYCLKRRC